MFKFLIFPLDIERMFVYDVPSSYERRIAGQLAEGVTMMARRKMGLTDRHKRILAYLDSYQKKLGYPPSIREIGEHTGVSSTSVVNYYLDQLEEAGYIARESNISRGIRILKTFGDSIATNARETAAAVGEMLRIPIVGRIVAGAPIPVPSNDFSHFDPDTGINIARSMLPVREKSEDLFALEVHGDSMVDAMVNDGDLVIMKKINTAVNGDMVAVWLRDRDETTLKYFYLEGGRVRLQPANPTMQPIYIEDPATVEVQGKVVLVIRQMNMK
jgi:repressor LexA